MKYFKKLVAVVSAIALALCMGATAFAAGEGKITIEDAVEGQTYKVYQVLGLESFDAGSGAYSYKATEGWADFINSDKINGVYVVVDDQGYVTWKDSADAAKFAQLARDYANDNGLTETQAKKADSETVVFDNLDLGYYLLDSTLGILCSLDTTNPEVVMEEKNSVPSITKEVQEDSSNEWGSSNDADFNQNVNFRATITVQAGAENYIMHDKMSEGLTYVRVDSVTVKGVDVATANYEVVVDTEDDCTFEVVFDNAYVATLDPGTDIVVEYSATLNQNAIVGLPGNTNEVALEYGDDGYTEHTPKVETVTYTWDVDVLKYANGDKSKVLADAKFVLLNGDKSKVASIVDGKLVEWVDYTEDMNVDAYKLTTGADGKIFIKGLDASKYFLVETDAPAGYNKLPAPVEFSITGATDANDDKVLEYSTLVVEVENKSGAELPSTGGMGTTIMYIAGAALVLIAGVALVVKRRMAASK